MIGVLVSGGVDSAVLLELASQAKLPAVGIYINWGQPAQWYEDTAARNLCDYYGIERRVIIAHHIMSAQMDIGTGSSGSRFVRGRNLAFLSMACTSNHEIKQIWIGCCRTDWDDYADCTPDFIARADSIFSLYGVQICAPLLQLDKEQIHNYAEKKKVPIDMAWSCYQADIDSNPCGKCNSCQSNNPKSWR
mgnify:FL=1